MQMKITCDVIQDLLPSYVDNICSMDSRRLVDEHIKSCENCKRKLEYMRDSTEEPTLPDVETLEKAREPFKKIKKRNRLHVAISAVIAVIVTSCVCYLAACAVDNVDFLRDIVHPQTFVTVNQDTAQDDWTPLYIPDDGFLRYSSIFSKKEVVNYADGAGAVAIRILDKNGNVVIDEITVAPGTSASLDALKRNETYRVETKYPAGGVLLVFE